MVTHRTHTHEIPVRFSPPPRRKKTGVRVETGERVPSSSSSSASEGEKKTSADRYARRRRAVKLDDAHAEENELSRGRPGEKERERGTNRQTDEGAGARRHEFKKHLRSPCSRARSPIRRLVRPPARPSVPAFFILLLLTLFGDTCRSGHGTVYFTRGCFRCELRRRRHRTTAARTVVVAVLLCSEERRGKKKFSPYLRPPFYADATPRRCADATLFRADARDERQEVVERFGRQRAPGTKCVFVRHPREHVDCRHE